LFSIKILAAQFVGQGELIFLWVQAIAPNNGLG
jgi:hypothetical protein